MIGNYIENANFEDTGFSYTLSLISGKYKMVILYCLMEYEPVRFNEMRRYLGNVSDKTLSAHLKELEADGLIQREVYPQIPPKVEYRLTERGQSLMKVLDQLCVWGEENKPKSLYCPEERCLSERRFFNASAPIISTTASSERDLSP